MTQSDVLSQWFNKIDRDIAFLIDCFAEVLTDLGRGDIAERLPWRSDTDGLGTNNDIGDGARVEQELQMLSVAYHLLNLVEEHAAAQARRSRESEFGMLHEPGLWGHGLRQLHDAGMSAEEIAGGLKDTNVEIVLTAHPTEAKRPAVLRQHRSLYETYDQLQSQEWTEYEKRALRREIVVVLERLWRTGEMYLKKPDVLSELDHVLDYFRMIFPDAVLEVNNRMKDAWTEAGFDLEAITAASDGPRLTFGDWVGGDRDGHPLVTAEITREALGKLRTCAIDLAEWQLADLSESLTLSDLFQTPPDQLLNAVQEGRARLAEAGEDPPPDHAHEPWRQFVSVMRSRLDVTRKDSRAGYATPRDLEADLNLLRKALTDVGADRIAKAEIDPVLLQIRTFGFHTAALDIRQNSGFHAKAVSQLLKAAGFFDSDYASWDMEKRRALLQVELRTARPLAPRHGELGDEARAVIDCFQVVTDHVKRYGKAGIGSFIVSMTQDVSDLLVVYLFAREVGLLRYVDGGMCSDISIVPLFETLSDLENGSGILEEFLDHPITKRMHARTQGRKPIQQVMVGYSDSNKDAGILASQWALNRAQRSLAQVGQKFGVDVMFFHGRGGTFSRGAGPTHRFLESLPPRSLSGDIRLTEQGEVIAQKFGNLSTAVFNLELLMAGMSVTVLKNRSAETEEPAFAEICQALSTFSREAYQSLLAGNTFLDFWQNATPIDALERSFIGSRPARRTGQRTLDDLRAIPWVFSWTQARYYLPGWYGVGTAIERLKTEKPDLYGVLQDRFFDWNFIRYVINNAETSLASADRDIMWEYAQLVPNENARDEQFNLIAAEYDRTNAMIDELFGRERSERRPRLVKTLEMRADGLKRLHTMQIGLLREWRSREPIEENEKDPLLPALLLSVNAIAGAERTTG